MAFEDSLGPNPMVHPEPMGTGDEGGMDSASLDLERLMELARRLGVNPQSLLAPSAPTRIHVTPEQPELPVDDLYQSVRELLLHR